MREWSQVHRYGGIGPASSFPHHAMLERDHPTRKGRQMRYWTAALIAATSSVALALIVWPTAALLLPVYWVALAYVLLQLRDILRIALLIGSGGILLMAWFAQRMQARSTLPAPPSGAIIPFPTHPASSPQRRAA